MANPDFTWLKWYPARAQNSLRWQSLSVEERGLFRELYDLAALANPRGALVAPNGCDLNMLLAVRLHLDVAHFRHMIDALIAKKLVRQPDAQTLVFPDFASHQRNCPARVRRKGGTKAAQKWRIGGAQEEEEEEEVEVEVEKEQRKDVSGEPQKDAASPPAALLSFPTVGKAKVWHLTQAYLDELAETYSNLDVLFETRKALAWVKAKPNRRKTAQGMKAFLVKWMNKATDSGWGSKTVAPRPSDYGDAAELARQEEAELRRMEGKR